MALYDAWREMDFKLKGMTILIAMAVLLFTGTHGNCIAEATEATDNDKLVLGANIRFRYESMDNFNLKYYGEESKQGKSDDAFLLGRFRLGMDFFPTKKIHLAVWGQHAEVWNIGFKDSDFYNSNFDQENNPYKDHWELYNTYVEVKQILNQPLDIKAGRQIIAYGDKRIFGPGQWGNSGKWIWDAVKLSYKLGGGFVDAYYGRTMLHDPDQFSMENAHGFESYGLYSHFNLPQNLMGMGFEPFVLTKDNDRNLYKGEDGQWGDFNSYYLGCRIFKTNLNRFDADLTVVKQEGGFANDDIDAYAYHLLLAYNFDDLDFNPRISVEYSYASGDSNPNDNKNETFDGVFGARDKMYGRMNLFHWKNLKDAQINFEVKPKKNICLKAEFHQFWLAEEQDAWYLNKKEYRDKTGDSGNKIGREFDLVGKFKLPGGNEIQAGYGHFWPDEFAEKLASDNAADWFFLQWSYNFSCGVL